MMLASRCPSPREYVVSKTDFFPRVWALKSKLSARGGSALPCLTPTLVSANKWTKWAHKNWAKIPKIICLILLCMQWIVWDLILRHGKSSLSCFPHLHELWLGQEKPLAWAISPTPPPLPDQHSAVGERGIKGALPSERSSNTLGEKI